MSEECRRAFAASLGLLKDKCGVSFEVGGKTVKLEEVSATVKVPPEIEKIASKENPITRAEKVEAIARSKWGRGYAEGVCRWVTGEAKPECVDRLARQLAEKVIV